MRKYCIIQGKVEFYNEALISSTREVKYRPRYSSVWAKYAEKPLPFRVSNYFLPTLFYNGIVDRNNGIDFGYDKVKRGIWRNELAKILKENYDLR